MGCICSKSKKSSSNLENKRRLNDKEKSKTSTGKQKSQSIFEFKKLSDVCQDNETHGANYFTIDKSDEVRSSHTDNVFQNFKTSHLNEFVETYEEINEGLLKCPRELAVALEFDMKSQEIKNNNYITAGLESRKPEISEKDDTSSDVDWSNCENQLNKSHSLKSLDQEPLSSEASLENKTIIIDIGSENIRYGFANDERPRNFQTIIGNPLSKCIKSVSFDSDTFIGSDAVHFQKYLALRSPIDHGIITNWNDMERIWEHVFSKTLKVKYIKEHPVMLLDSPVNPKLHRQEMMEILFEKFNVNNACIVNQASASFFASGKANGVVLSCGHSATYIVPMFNGIIRKGIVSLDYGGKNLTDYLSKLLSQRGYRFQKFSDLIKLKYLKENYGFVSPNFNDDLFHNESKYLIKYKDVTMGCERFACPEALFNPVVLGYQLPGLHKAIVYSIKMCNDLIQDDLFKSIILTGGSTKFPGFKHRMSIEIANVIGTKELKIYELSNDDTAWRGGSLISNTFINDLLISKEEYFESGGVRLLHERSFY